MAKKDSTGEEDSLNFNKAIDDIDYLRSIDQQDAEGNFVQSTEDTESTGTCQDPTNCFFPNCACYEQMSYTEIPGGVQDSAATCASPINCIFPNCMCYHQM